MRELLEVLEEEFHTTLVKTQGSVPRSFSFPETKTLIKVAIGMRRSGKTYYLFEYIHSLLKAGTPLESIVYINFEDDRLLPLDQKKMASLLDSFYTLHPENHDRECYLFLDEVQNVEGWEQVVRRFYDTKNIQLYLTGSSAKLLSKEIATSLRGRSIANEIWPYNFFEYLLAHKINLPSKPFGNQQRDIYQQHLLNFFHIGGFPGVQKELDNIRLEMLQGYVDMVIFRDIVERHKVTNLPLLKYLIGSLLKSVGSPFTVNKFYKDITSQGFSVSKDTIFNYIHYIQDAYLIFTVPLFSESLRHQQTSPSKVYAIDNGLIQACTLNFSSNYGSFLENQVYLDLRRQGKDIFYYKTNSGYEIDFVTQAKDGTREIIQVTWEMHDPKTREREERALQEAKTELGIPGRIIDVDVYLRSIESEESL